jgi:predicted oxidoreductase
MKTVQNNCLIYGCMGLGGGWNRDPLTSDDEKTATEAIYTAMEIGINTFDLADIYAYGKSEEVFGKVLKSHPGLRDKITLQSKTGIMPGKGPENSSIYNVQKDYLIKQVRAILERLETDHLDVLLLHRPDVLMDASEVAETFYYLKEQGYVKQFGVSNMSVSQIMLIRNYWKDDLMADQIRLSLGHSMALDIGISVNTSMVPYDSGMQGLLEYCQLNNMAVQAWAPLDHGLYTGKAHASLDEKDLMTAMLVSRLAGKYNVPESSVVLAWLFMIPGIIQPIIGTTKPDRIRDCRYAPEIKLSHEEWYELWISARGKRLP